MGPKPAGLTASLPKGTPAAVPPAPQRSLITNQEQEQELEQTYYNIMKEYGPTTHEQDQMDEEEPYGAGDADSHG